MSIDLDAQVRRLDPAGTVTDDLLDADGSTAATIHDRIVDAVAVDEGDPPRLWRRWRALVAGGVTVAAVGAGAVAVADRPPPETSMEVCDTRGVDREAFPPPPPACADVQIPAILASIEANGSDRERALVADGVISDDEWERINDDLIGCLRAAGMDAELDPEPFLDVTIYGVTWRVRGEVDGDQALRDDQTFRDCEAQHKPYRLAALHQAQAIGRQEGPRLTPGEVRSILDEDARRGDVFGPDDPDAPMETMTPLDGDG